MPSSFRFTSAILSFCGTAVTQLCLYDEAFSCLCMDVRLHDAELDGLFVGLKLFRISHRKDRQYVCAFG